MTESAWTKTSVLVKFNQVSTHKWSIKRFLNQTSKPWRMQLSVTIYYYWLLSYSAISPLSSKAHCAGMWFYTLFIAHFVNIHRSGVLTALAWLGPQETAAISAQVLCSPYDHAPCHFMQSHIRKVYACLAVTCHLRFWQNDRGLLRATAVTRGWNGYQNKSQHRRLTLEKKILPPLQQGFEPMTFRTRVRCSNHWAIPAPNFYIFHVVCVSI